MGYQQILQRASFRGIHFHVETSERKMGYKYKLHVFPGTKKKAHPEELSEVPQIFPVEAFFIGPDAAYSRDLLIAACRKRKPGKLHHPQIGFIDAKCKSLRVREVFSRVGKIYLSMEFVEYEQPIDMNNPFDMVRDALDTANKALDGAMADMVDAMAVLDMPAYALANVAGMVNKIANFITSKNGLGRIASTITDFKDVMDSLADEAENLINSPQKLANQIKDALGYLRGEEAIEAHQAFKNEVIFPVPSGLSATEEKIVELKNAIAGYTAAASTVVAVEKLIAGIRGESLALEIEREYDLFNQSDDFFTSNLEARQYNEMIIRSIESDMEFFEPEQYARLQALKTALKQIEYLPETEVLELPESLPSLVLAYDRYEDLDREPDILRRNHSVAYPGEVTGELEVVSG